MHMTSVQIDFKRGSLVFFEVRRFLVLQAQLAILAQKVNFGKTGVFAILPDHALVGL